MWWHPSATDAAAGLLPGLLAEHTHSTAAAAAAADTDDIEGGPGGTAAVGAAQLLQLAAGMRMTTDARRAVFVAIMGSEDCAEASEKLLRLPLKVRRIMYYQQCSMHVIDCFPGQSPTSTHSIGCTLQSVNAITVQYRYKVTHTSSL